MPGVPLIRTAFLEVSFLRPFASEGACPWMCTACLHQPHDYHCQTGDTTSVHRCVSVSVNFVRHSRGITTCKLAYARDAIR